MSINRKVLLKGLQRSLGFQSIFTLDSAWTEAGRYYPICKPKDSELHWCTQRRRGSSISEVSEALKQPSGQQDFFKLLGM